MEKTVKGKIEKMIDLVELVKEAAVPIQQWDHHPVPILQSSRLASTTLSALSFR